MTQFTLPRRQAVLGATGLVASSAFAPAHAAVEGPWAIELFTSQGCSSCPPADKMLGRLAQRSDIVALSLNQRYVYTPEMVFDGQAHETGTRAGDVDRMIARMRDRKTPRATTRLQRAADGSLTIALEALTVGRPADIVLAVYDRHHRTPVPRGENTGSTLENFNVVRRLEKVATWDGQATRFSVAADRFAPGQAAAVLVEAAGHGAILGCNKLEMSASG